MALSDGLNIIFNMLSSILGVFMATPLFGIPFGVYFVGAFVIFYIMYTAFSIQPTDLKVKSRSGSHSDGGGGNKN